MSTSPITLVPRVWTDEPLKPRRERLWLAEGKLCHWCKCPTRMITDVGNWDCATNDHVIPRYKGGANEDHNIVSACARCNNRRNQEDMCGLPEGSLLGKWKMDSNIQSPNIGKHKLHPRALSRDEKKALMARMDKSSSMRMSASDVIREQRDQSLKRIAELEKEVDKWKTLANGLESQSVVNIIRKRLAKWLLDIG